MAWGGKPERVKGPHQGTMTGKPLEEKATLPGRSAHPASYQIRLLEFFQFFDVLLFFDLELFASVCPALLWFCVAPAVPWSGLVWGRCDSGPWSL